MKRINLNLPQRIFDTLKRISDDGGYTMTDVIKKSILLMAWYIDLRSDGKRLIIEKDGEQHTIELF